MSITDQSTPLYHTWGKQATRDYYPDVASDLAELDTRLDTLRQLWASDYLDAEGRKDVVKSGQELVELRTRKQFRLNRHEDEVIAERYVLDNNVNYDSTLPQTDSEWLSWKVNKFIKNISRRTQKGSLIIGHVKIGGRTVGVEDGFFEFRCYKTGCKFHGRHYVGGSQGQVEVILSMILAHWYKHA